MTPQQARQAMRDKRNLLTSVEQQAAADKLSKVLLLNFPPQATRVAVYLANDGEINPMTFIRHLWQKNVEVYLPVLHPFCSGHLLFLRFEAHTKMCRNKFGIPEPVLNLQSVIPASQLDIIYTPLVAFDEQGNRLGMGGGYYDRTLAANPHINAIGLAHSCQKLPALKTQPWDMPMRFIATPDQWLSAC